MLAIDTTSSLRIAVILEMLEEVSRATDPEAAFRAYAKRIRRVRPIDAYALVSMLGLPTGCYKVTRWFRSESLGGSGLSAVNPWQDWDSLPVHTGGFVGQVIAGREPQLYQNLAIADDPALDKLLLGMGSCMCVPIFEAGKVTAWSLMFRADPRGYTPQDLEDELLIGNLLGAMTQNLVSLGQISALNARLRGQFDEVARVQHALLPASLPDIPGVTFAASYQPSGGGGGAGGDYYDFFTLGQEGGRVGVIIADVSGHGPAAATVMAMLHATLHARPDLTAHPAAAMKFANARLTESSTEGGHVTAVLGVLDASARTLTLARAGHPLPRLRLADGSVRPLSAEGSPPMGINANPYEPAESTVQLQPGQTVVLYTDGVTEAENPAGHQFGDPGLDQAIASSPGDPASVIASVHTALATHTTGAEREDDQTLVVLRVER